MPTSTYSLRKSGGASPAKDPKAEEGDADRGAGGLKGSPGKKARPATCGALNAPAFVVAALESAGVLTLAQIGVLPLDQLLERVVGTIGEPADGSQHLRGAKHELLAAWIRGLHAHAQSPATALAPWQHWLDARVLERAPPAAARTSGEPGAPVSRRELIRQRQGLKRRNAPRSRLITWSELRDGRGRLTALPVGKALGGAVQPDALASARKRLRGADRPTA